MFAGFFFVGEIIVDDVIPAFRRSKTEKAVRLRKSGLVTWIK